MCVFPISSVHGLAVLNVDELVREAVDAYKAGEALEVTVVPKVCGFIHSSEMFSTAVFYR